MYRDDKAPFVLEIDDETDEDFLSVILDRQLPAGVRMSTCEHIPDFGSGTGGKGSEEVDSLVSINTSRELYNGFQFRKAVLQHPEEAELTSGISCRHYAFVEDHFGALLFQQ